MLQILFLLVSVSAVIPMMSLTRTQYLLPCNVCTKALLYEMESPSVTADDFIKKASNACHRSTLLHREQEACIFLLRKHARTFVQDQRRTQSVYSTCAQTTETDCKIRCDKRKKRGYCHVIISE